MTRLRIWSTIAASWVAMITVVPTRLMRSSSFMMPTLVAGSRLPVGSSASSNGGRLTNARAIATRCCSPPDNWWVPSRFVGQADQVQHLGDSAFDLRVLAPEHLKGESDVLIDGLVRQQPEVLEHRTHPATQLRDFPARQRADVATRDDDLAGGGLLLTQDQAHEGGLAGARRAHQEHELAGLHGDVDVLQRWAVSLVVALADALERDQCFPTGVLTLPGQVYGPARPHRYASP